MSFGPYGHPYGPGQVPTRRTVTREVPVPVKDHDDFPENKTEPGGAEVLEAGVTTVVTLRIRVKLRHGDLNLAISPEEARVVLTALRMALEEFDGG